MVDAKKPTTGKAENGRILFENFSSEFWTWPFITLKTSDYKINIIKGYKSYLLSHTFKYKSGTGRKGT